MPPVQQHHRAHSFSTLNDKAKAVGSLDVGTHEGTTDRPGRLRPKTADHAKVPILKVQIPHYRLGSPRFSAHGTAFLHSSIYTQTSTNDELTSSMFAPNDIEKMFPVPPGMASSSPSPLQHPQHHPVASSGLARGLMPLVDCFSSSSIDPRLYDDLTFGPKADDPSVVRYHPVTRSVVAATVPRLIAQITSPNFLDYDLLSDFFLTFRCFMASGDLLAYLMARLGWAASRHDEVGKIVTVRTFVALRHWILNYFVDDFVPDYTLRAKFCEMLNSLCAALKTSSGGVVKESKIIGELKRCWQRTCALYWDTSKVVTDDPDGNIFPGGRPGSREEQATVTGRIGRPTTEAVPAQIDAVIAQSTSRPGRDELFSDVKVPTKPSVNFAAQTTQHAVAQGLTRVDPIARAKSLSSDFSAPVLSCSIPAKGFKRAARAANLHHGVHSAKVITSVTQPRPDADPEAGHHSMQARPLHVHKRSGSFSDALRDRRVPLPQPKTDLQVPQVLMAVPFAGSLIRGNRLPPTQAIVREIAPSTPVYEGRNGRSSPAQSAETVAIQQKSFAAYGPGMRKLFGSVRRVLNYRDGGDQELSDYNNPPHSSHSTISKPASAHVYSRRTASADQSMVRVDLLAATIVEGFKAAINEERDIEARGPAGFLRDLARHDDGSVRVAETGRSLVDPKEPGSLTEGSKSIVIVNDTRPPIPEFVPKGSSRQASRGASTPHVPLSDDRSAYLHGKIQSSSQSSQTQSLHRTAGRIPSSAEQCVVEGDVGRPSKRSEGRRSIVRVSSQFYPRVRSSQSDSLRRYASFQSKLTGIITERSFDATTVTDSENDPLNDAKGRLPARMLRRRPGGDLRAAEKVADLRHNPRPRSRSLSAKAESVEESIVRTIGTVITSVTNREVSREQRRRFSVGALADTGDIRSISLIQTHSSQPNLRPSFESEVARLAQLPDDEDDDGGVESTLLKLEGRFERRSSDEELSNDQWRSSVDDHEGQGGGSRFESSSETESFRGKGPVVQGGSEPLSSRQATPSALKDQPNPKAVFSDRRSKVEDAYVHTVIGVSAVESEDSYSSTPILERGLSTKSFGGSRSGLSHSTLSVPRPLMPRRYSRSAAELVSRHPSAKPAEESGSVRRLLASSTVSRDSIAQGSFLLDDNDLSDSFLLDDDEDLSDLSSEFSDDTIHTSEGSKLPTTTFPRVTSDTVISEIGLPFHPLRHPPSPPPAFGQAVSVPPASKGNGFTRGPPTPDPSPVDRAGPLENRKKAAQPLPEPPRKATDPTNQAVTGSSHAAVHLPFVLGHGSETLAQQFTLLEKDALSGIDWKELVDLRASKASLDTRNWFEFLKTHESKGVDLVIARFNVMTKWVLSEVVMTQDLEERARTISKYIHIAAHSRRLHNYATMYQLTTALLSIDCERLKQTWNLVPPADQETVNDLEALVQPVRNFQKLRAEMEMAAVEDRCIPFLGQYP